MAANRYGQIWHGDHHHINIRFPSTEARLKFQNEFEEYHASHDHEGDIPIFKFVGSKDCKSYERMQDLVKAETDESYRITIDGYSWNEIHEYHNPNGWKDSFWYSVPTCCVSPVIVIDREFLDSGTLERHALSAIFTDMPEEDFASLLESVQKDGFIDPMIRLLGTEVLDGWHRYRVAKELNLIRKLRFKQWDEHDEGDPAVFVMGRNLERRHLSAQQRAQIVVHFNERFEKGNVKAQQDTGSPNGEPKTRDELAKKAGVGTSTIDRAVAVEKEGASEAVIAGEKSASEVLKEREAKKLLKQKKMDDTDVGEVENSAGEVDPKFQGAVHNAEVRLSWMWDSFEDSEIAKHLSREEFALVVAQQFDWYIENDYGSGENYLLEEEFALLKNLGSIGEANKWRKRFDTVQDAIHENASWIVALIPEVVPETEVDTPDTETTKTGIDLTYDLNQMRVLSSTLTPLLKSLGADDMNPHYKEILTSDLYNVFLEYENVPTEKEMIIALLGVVDLILSEEIANV